MRKTVGWAVALVFIVVAIVLIFILPRLDKEDAADTDTTSSQTANQQAAQNQDRPQLIIGDPEAPKTIVEYGDYKCPNCARFHTSTYAELKTEYLDTGKAKIVFKNRPYIAEDSRVAADGTYCANEQGLFEQYHNEIYDYISNLYAMEGLSKEFENVLTLDLLSGIVGDAGGDRQQFARCLEDQKYKAQVDEDFASSEQEGATATPTFIIDGQKIVGAQPITLFRPLLEEN